MKDVPLITVVQPPRPPALKSWPKRRLLAVAGVMLGVLIAFLTVLLELHFSTVPPDERQAMSRLSDAWQGVRREARSVLRR